MDRGNVVFLHGIYYENQFGKVIYAIIIFFFQELKGPSKPGSRRGSFNPDNKDDGGGGGEVCNND